MKKNMHAKTIAIVLAATTVLQVTGLTSQLLNGVPFVVANAVTGGGTGILATATTSSAVAVGDPSIGQIISFNGQVTATVPTRVESDSYLSSYINIRVTTDASVLLGNADAYVQWFIKSDRTEAVGVVFFSPINIGGHGYDLLPIGPPTPELLRFKVTIGAETGTTTSPAVTMPSNVRINGTERVGKTLEAQLYLADYTRFTTSAGVTYQWYRLSSQTSTSGTLVGTDDTYKLVSSDKDNYIKLYAWYNGVLVNEDITGSIDKRSSSGSSSSSSDDNEDNNTTSTNNNSELKVGFEKISDGKFKITENGHVVAGWKQINGQWYLADSIGTMQTGWRQAKGVWYLLKEDGVMATGWHRADGNWYLLNDNGEMTTGWQLVGGKWYLLNPSGHMATGWQLSNGKWYYLYSDGSMANATVIDGYEVDMNGEWIQ